MPMVVAIGTQNEQVDPMAASFIVVTLVPDKAASVSFVIFRPRLGLSLGLLGRSGVEVLLLAVLVREVILVVIHVRHAGKHLECAGKEKRRAREVEMSVVRMVG